MSTIAQDTFTRANQSGFGTSSGADVWGSPVNTTFASPNIVSNQGVVSNGSSADTQIILGSQTPTNINMLIRTSTSDTGNLNGLLWRYTSSGGGSGYRCGFFGGTSFNVDKYTSGSRSNIASGSVSGGYNTNELWWIRLIHTAGGTLSIRWWKDGTSEPANFTGFISQSETTYSSGNFGVSMFLNGTSSTVTYDNLTVTDNQSTTTSTRTISATSALLATNTRTITDTAALLQTSTRTISDTAALLATSQRTIGTNGALQATSSRSVGTTAALIATLSRTIGASASLANARVIPATAALKGTLTRSIGATASLVTGGFAPNATVFVRSGRASVQVRSGRALVTIHR